MNTFFNSQFNYCPLIWMYHSRENNNQINRLHERCLRIIYNGKRSSFNALLEKDGSISIHERNIKILAKEMFKVSKNLAPHQMQEIFKLKDQPHYNLRYNSLFFRPLVKSVYKGTESLSFLRPKIWDILPDTYKDMSDLNSFKLASKMARVTSCMSFSKKRSLMNTFFNSQFNYCPLIWMYHSRENNNQINRLHERCLRIIYNGKRSSFNALLEKDGSISIHERNIKILAKEMFKVSKNLAPHQMQEIFKLKDQPHYNLRYNSLFFRPLVKSVYKGTESLSFLRPKIWDILPDTYKDMSDLNSFKLASKKFCKDL